MHTNFFKPLQPTRFVIQESGFSLVEVLISVVILSFGLLGMVGLQAAALQGNRDARLQSTAINLARELAETMRGNKYIALLAVNNPYLGNFNTSPLVAAAPSYCLNVGLAPTACGSNTVIAAAHMTEWLGRVSNDLPNPRVTVCVDSAPYAADGTPRWACDASGVGATTVIKIGWTRASTDRSQTGAAALKRTTDIGSAPTIVFPITAGNEL